MPPSPRSGHRFVIKLRKRGRYTVILPGRVYLGIYDSLQEAIQARDNALSMS